MISQGGESNGSGKMLEGVIEREFRRFDIPVFDHSENGDNGDLFAEKFLLRNAPYTSIYGCRSRSEFLYVDFRLQSHIRIECRWQEVSGSVDEKLAYLFLNATRAMPERVIWIVLDGGGARAEAVDWIRREVGQVANKTIRILSLPEARQRIKHVVLRSGDGT